MKSSLLHRSTALTMAFLMFFASVGFSVDMHFCRGEFKSLSIFGEAKSCHEKKTVCPQHGIMMANDEPEKDCCSNRSIVVDELDEDYTMISSTSVPETTLQFLTAYVYSSLENRVKPNAVQLFSKNETPDPPVDIYVRLERYLL